MYARIKNLGTRTTDVIAQSPAITTYIAHIIAQYLAQIITKSSTISWMEKNYVPQMSVKASMILIIISLVLIAQKSVRLVGWLFDRTRLFPKVYVLGN